VQASLETEAKGEAAKEEVGRGRDRGSRGDS